MLVVDVASGDSRIETITLHNCFSGSGLAIRLFTRYQNIDAPWHEQPLVFCKGLLTGYFPLMSKMVCGFASCLNNKYTESTAGGRAALALAFCQVDGLVILGKAEKLTTLHFNSSEVKLKDASSLAGLNVNIAIAMVRQRMTSDSGRRSIMTIGPSGENLSAMACVNVDEYRHFGRMGGGAAMGAKNLKGIIISGDGNLPMPIDDDYPNLYQEIYQKIVDEGIQKNQIRSKLSEAHNGACAGCPVGCVHIAYIRGKLEEDPSYLQKGLGIDGEPVFASIKTLGVKRIFDILRIVEIMEKTCLDVISTASALRWATLATENGVIGSKETIVPLSFGNSQSYQQAIVYLSRASNHFYRSLGRGVHFVAKEFDFKGLDVEKDAELVLQRTEMPVGVMDCLPSVGEIVENKILKDEQKAVLDAMIGCLFAKKIYQPDVLARCLRSIGCTNIEERLSVKNIMAELWTTRFDLGVDRVNLKISSSGNEENQQQLRERYLEKVRELYLS